MNNHKFHCASCDYGAPSPAPHNNHNNTKQHAHNHTPHMTAPPLNPRISGVVCRRIGFIAHATGHAFLYEISV